MNLRSSQLASEILEGLEEKQIGDGIIIVNLPQGLDNQTVTRIGTTVTDALRAMGKTNPVLILPNPIKLTELPDVELEHLGLQRINKIPKEQLTIQGQPVKYYNMPPMTTFDICLSGITSWSIT